MASSPRAWILFLLGAALISPPPVVDAAAPPFCDSLALSPRFAADRTAFCVGLRVDGAGAVTGVSVITTRDGGATWQPVRADGLASDPATSIGAVVVSPAFADDRTVFVQSTLGLFRSSDAGATFQMLDPLVRPSAGGPDNVAAFRDSPLLPVGDTAPRTVLAYAGGDQSRRVEAPLSRPAVGAPGYDVLPVVAPNGTATPDLLFLTAEDDPSAGAARPYRDALYRCDRQLTCVERLWRFPAGWYAERVWAGTAAKGPAPLYAQLRKVGADHVVEVHRSTDGGRTFASWQPLTALLAPLAKARASRPAVWLAETGAPGTLFVRIAHGGARSSASSAPSGEQLYTSRDGGRSWRLVATNGYGTPRNAPGRLGWTSSDLRLGPRLFAAGGRLFALGDTATYKGVFCSTDGGLRWYQRCRA